MLFCRKSTNKHFKIHRRYTGKGIPKQEKTHVPRSDAQDTLWKMRIIDSCYRKDLQSNSSSPSAPPKESTTPGDRNIFSSSIEPWYGKRRLSQSRLWRFPREACPDQKTCRLWVGWAADKDACSWRYQVCGAMRWNRRRPFIYLRRYGEWWSIQTESFF